MAKNRLKRKAREGPINDYALTLEAVGICYLLLFPLLCFIFQIKKKVLMQIIVHSLGFTYHYSYTCPRVPNQCLVCT